MLPRTKLGKMENPKAMLNAIARWTMLMTAITAVALLALCPSGVRGRNRVQSSQVEYTVGPNVDITLAQQEKRHYEAYVGASPLKSRELIACDYVLRGKGDSDDFFYLSHDSGATWKLVLTMPHFTDPSCAIGSDGALFAAGVSNGAKATLGVMRSVNGGHKWLVARIPSLPYDIDRPYLTVVGTHRRRAKVIVHAYRFARTPPPAALFFVSHDDGRSFSPPIVKKALEYPKPWYFVGNGAVGRGGAYYGLFAELDNTKKNMSYRTDPASAPSSPDAQLELYRSDDLGNHIALAGVIQGVYYDWRVGQLSMPSLAVDASGGPHRGRLYVSWPDARFGQHTSILLAYSDDSGRTWSEPHVIAGRAEPGTVNQEPNDFMPMVAVNCGGVVGVSWYDRRDSKDNFSYNVRFAASVDGGHTWLPSVRVSNYPYIPGSDMHKNGGDTAGLAADAAGVFHLTWIANPSGIPAMWTAAVRVHSIAAPAN